MRIAGVLRVLISFLESETITYFAHNLRSRIGRLGMKMRVIFVLAPNNGNLFLNLGVHREYSRRRRVV